MLVKLKIKNIALISESIIEFSNGLNVLTGETGAGKSLIIDSLNFVLGARADKSLIKHGESFAQVEAVFEINNITSEISEFFESINLEPESTIIISRHLNLDGKNDIRVNGQTVTNSMLKKLTPYLVDLHGQHAHQSLLDPKNHLGILDSFNDLEISPLKERLQEKLNEYKIVLKQIEDIGGDGLDRARNIELLEYQINEIEQAQLKPNEDDDLISRKTLLLNSEKIHNNLNIAGTILQNGDTNILSMFKLALNNLKNVAHYDQEIQDIENKLEELYFEVLNQSELVNDKLESLSFSESELNDIEERLDLIKSFKRKYGSTIEDVLEYLEQSKTKLDNLLNADEKLNKLNKTKQLVLSEIYHICKQLTEVRVKTAKNIENKIEEQLAELGMKKSKFAVEFLNEYNLENIDKFATINGADDVEFMFSANLGEPLKPLSKIISGGEMSRFMLAVKCVVSGDSNKTFIFDEIDNGIGGTTGTIVAQKLAKLGLINQVICVTHLAQIASYATSNYKITKYVENDKTKTKVEIVEGIEKLKEISRLLGSNEDSELGIMHAKEMLESAKSTIEAL